MNISPIVVALFYADDQTDKHNEANIGFSPFFFFCERPRKRDLSYAFPQLKNRSKVRNFMPLHLCISPVLHSFIRAYSTFTNSKYGGSSRRNSQKLLHSAYISRLVFLSFPPYYFHFSSEAISNRA